MSNSQSGATYTELAGAGTYVVGTGLIYHDIIITSPAAGTVTVKDGNTVIVASSSTANVGKLTEFASVVGDGIKMKGSLSAVVTGAATLLLIWE